MSSYGLQHMDTPVLTDISNHLDDLPKAMAEWEIIKEREMRKSMIYICIYKYVFIYMNIK